MVGPRRCARTTMRMDPMGRGGGEAGMAVDEEGDRREGREEGTLRGTGEGVTVGQGMIAGVGTVARTMSVIGH